MYRCDVSVVMAVKNESRYIEDALNSIVSQEGVDFEVVVVDDHSDDDTYDQILRIAGKNPGIRPLRNPGRGKVAAFNAGAALAGGRFVCLFAGDDIMPPGSLASRWAVVADLPESKPAAGLFKILTMSEDKRFDGKLVPRAKGKGNPSGQSPLMNRAMVDLLFPVPESLPNEDTWLEIALCHTDLVFVRHSDVICCHWRVHEGNSYNLNTPFAEFKRRMVSRWKAYDLFRARFIGRLTPKDVLGLGRMAECVRYYEEGRVWPLAFARIGLVDRLRMLATINPVPYSIRRTFYGLFSGW